MAEEQSYVVLSDGSIFSVYRTIDGYPAFTYSRDGGHTWDEPQYLKYANGKLIKHPRAANFVWKCENEKYLYWFHNHGGKFIEKHPNRPIIAYSDRNPVWIAGGIEADSPNGKIILWSQPEILLYDDDPIIRMSYPDLIEDLGNYYISETQKDLARVHIVDKNMLNNLWKQFDLNNKTKDKLVLEWQEKNEGLPVQLKSPKFPVFYKPDYNTVDHKGMRLPNGFTVELAFCLNDLSVGQILIDNRTYDGIGWCIRINDKQVEFFE